MQRSKHVTLSITLGSTTARKTKWGDTTTATMYASQNDALNTAIATFLKECGVTNAAYEYRTANGDASTEKWLYINNIPFFFYHIYSATAASNYFGVSGPNYKYQVSSAYYPWSAANSATADFYLFFCGDPNSSWALRLSANGATAPTTATTFRYLKATNMCTNATGAIYFAGNQTVTLGGYVTGGHCCLSGTAVDKNSVPDYGTTTQTTNDYINVHTGGHVKEYMMANSKMPLIPITAGVMQADGAYKMITGMNLSACQATSVATQTEQTVGSTKLIIGMAEVISATNSGYYLQCLLKSS